MAQVSQTDNDNLNSEILSKLHLNTVAPHIGHEYFESKEYVDLIPESNPKWIWSELNTKLDKYDASNLDSFMPPHYDASHSNIGHPYINDVLLGLKIFKTWRHLPHSNNKKALNAWKFLKEVDNELKIYWTHIPNEAISAMKSVMIVPYAVPIIAGIVANDKHARKYNPNIAQEEQLQNLNEYNLIWHCSVKPPMRFITSRDMLTVRFIYVLDDCEVIIGEKSIDSHPKDEWMNDKTYVRAHCTLNLWHIRPYYKGGNDSKHTHSHVTYYTHFRPNGSIPQWIVDQKIGEKAENILTVKKYMDSIKDRLHMKGVLHIAYPLLKMMKYVILSEKKDVECKENELDENIVAYQKEVYGIDPVTQKDD